MKLKYSLHLSEIVSISVHLKGNILVLDLTIRLSTQMDLSNQTKYLKDIARKNAPHFIKE